jgi:hypothetical protein
MGNNNASLLRSIQDSIQRVEQKIQKREDETRAGLSTTYLHVERVLKKRLTLFEGSAEKVRELRAKDKEVLAIYKEADGSNLPAQSWRETNLHSSPNPCFLGDSARLRLRTLCLTTQSAPSRGAKLLLFFRGRRELTFLIKSFETLYEGILTRRRVQDKHAEYFDSFKKEQAAIITPIWDPRKEWTPGTRYKLLVVATQEGYKWLMGSYPLDEAQRPWLGSADAAEYRTASDFLELSVTALAGLLNKSPLIDLVEKAYDDTTVDVVPQDVGAAKEGNSNNDCQTPIARVKEALENMHCPLSDIISGQWAPANQHLHSTLILWSGQEFVSCSRKR